MRSSDISELHCNWHSFGFNFMIYVAVNLVQLLLGVFTFFNYSSYLVSYKSDTHNNTLANNLCQLIL